MGSTISPDASPAAAPQAPSVAFMLRHPAHLIALGFGAGLSRVAPGTFGTLVAFPIAWMLAAFDDSTLWWLAIAAWMLAGVWAAQITGRDLGTPDHGSIVVDEIAAFLLVLFFAGSDPIRQVAAFALFRLFDIVKPSPIRQLDAMMKNGVGVMADDFLAAGYALLALALAQRLVDAFG